MNGNSAELTHSLRYAAVVLCAGAERVQWRGPDAYDGLWHNWPEWLRGGRRRRQAIVQIHVRSPFDVRRLYRKDHPQISKGVALFGHAGLLLDAAEGDPEVRATAERALDLLDADRSAGEEVWGYPFDMQTRWSFYPANSPNIIATSFAALALHEAGELWGHAGYSARAKAAAEWVVERLYDEDRGFFAYYSGGTVLVHNANVLGARIAFRILGDAERAGSALAHTLAAQRPDGSFPYGDGVSFCDSFHTGYVLDNLLDLRPVAPETEAAIVLGSRYYVDQFFGPAGETMLWPSKPYPLDGHAAGTALKTISRLVQQGYLDEPFLAKVSSWTLDNMLRNGHAVFRRYRLASAPVTYLRWSDGHMALGLASAASVQGLRK